MQLGKLFEKGRKEKKSMQENSSKGKINIAKLVGEVNNLGQSNSKREQTNRKNRRQYDFDIELGKDAKRSITRRLLQEQVQWFERESIKEIGIKVIVMAAIILIMFIADLLPFSIALSSIITSFFCLTTNKKFYRNQVLYRWGEASLFVSSFVFFNSVLTHFAQLSNGQLILPMYLNILMSVVYGHRRAIYSRYINNYVQSIPYVGRCLSETAYTFLQLKQILLITLIGTSILHTLVNYLFMLNKNLYQLLSISIIFWFVVSFCISILLLRVLLLYEQLTILPFQQTINSVNATITLLKLDPFTQTNRQIHIRCLYWVINFVRQNPNAMKAYPYHSKFYSTYWDVFKDYAEQQFSQSNSSLVQLNEKVQYLNLLNSKNKTLKQDIFIYFRIVGAAFRVHLQSIECLKYLAITNLVLEVYCKTEDETNLLPIQIRMMGEKLKGNSMNGKIPSLIRNKMREYSHNIEHILEKYKH